MTCNRTFCGVAEWFELESIQSPRLKLHRTSKPRTTDYVLSLSLCLLVTPDHALEGNKEPRNRATKRTYVGGQSSNTSTLTDTRAFLTKLHCLPSARYLNIISIQHDLGNLDTHLRKSICVIV